jgi:hypothetical protein
MNSGMSAIEVSQSIDDQYKDVPDFCSTHDYAPSTTYHYIRNGEIALHQFPGEARPKINVAEALRVLSKVKRRYTNPQLRIIRHDDSALPKQQSPKIDLFR